MAERRMFAKSVIGSARFLRMPPSSRLLYYDLGMQADDDGVVEAFAVMRTTGATEDDLRILASKEFIKVLNEDLVTYITDWSRNNYIQKDRYHQSVYQDLLVKLQGETETNQPCIQDVYNMDTQVRLGKVSIGKDRESTADKPPTRSRSEKKRFVPPTIEQVTEYVKQRGSKVDPQGFIDFYESKGWMVGKTPMKDWKAACRNAEHWERWKQNTVPSEREPVQRKKYRTEIVNGEEVDVLVDQ